VIPLFLRCRLDDLKSMQVKSPQSHRWRSIAVAARSSGGSSQPLSSRSLGVLGAGLVVMSASILAFAIMMALDNALG
jgi:hypothetical protein